MADDYVESLLAKAAINVANGAPPFSHVKLNRDMIAWITSNASALPGYTASTDDRNALDLRESILDFEDLEGIQLPTADLEGAFVQFANLRGAFLGDVRLIHADLEETNLENADLYRAVLDGSFFGRASLRRASLLDAQGVNVLMAGVDLREAMVIQAELVNVVMRKAHLSGAKFDGSNLDGGDFQEADFKHASLRRAQLHDANCTKADFSGADLSFADLAGSNLENAIFDVHTNFSKTNLQDTRLRGVQWGDADLSFVEWSAIRELRDETEAKKAPINNRPQRYREASEAYVKLSAALRNSGLTATSVDYHYRAALMTQRALQFEFISRLLFLAPSADARTETAPDSRGGCGIFCRLGRFVTSPVYLIRWLLWAVFGFSVGYGDKPFRAILVYVGTIVFFMVTYLLMSGHVGRALDWQESFVLSMVSFHGRGFSSTDLHLVDPLAMVSAFEAATGTMEELLFITAFVRRFIGA